MKGSRSRIAAGLLLVALLGPTLMIPSGSADDAPDVPFRPLDGLEGPRATLRLYGCSDALADSPPGTIATRLRGDGPAPGVPDGRPDCDGDRLHLGNAFLSSASDPAYRRALGARDQTVSASVRYLPTAWFPGPGHEGGISDLVDPTRGLFDVDDDGGLDLVPPDGAPQGPDGALLPQDLAPRATGDGGDLYFPALETRYDLTWTAGGNEPVAIPAGASFILPNHAQGAPTGIHDWSTEGAPTPVHWHPTPFGTGTSSDRSGALYSAIHTLEEGDVIWFLDHGIRITGFFGTSTSPRVAIEVLYLGAGHEETLEQSVILSPGDDATRHATIDRHSSQPTNVVFADRTGIDRNIPPFLDPEDPASDASWFALLEGLTVGDEDEPGRAEIRLGRIVSEQAPANAFAADGLLYRIAAVDERGGNLHRLGITSLHPIEEPAAIPSAGLTIEAWASEGPLPMLPPFDRSHVMLQDLQPDVVRTDGGFLTSGATEGAFGSSALALRADAQAPAERAAPAGPFQMQWRQQSQETDLIAPLVELQSDASATVGAVVPIHYLEVVLPDGRYRVDSVLMDDADVLSGATADPASPRGFRSFVFDPLDPRPLFADQNGLRLFSGTVDRRESGDLVRFDPALMHWDEWGRRIQTPDRLADQAVQLSLRYDANTPFVEGARPFPVNGSHLQDGGGGVSDNLWDAQTALPGPAPLPYAPAFRAAYTFGFLDRTSLEAVHPPLGSRTALLLPVADRDPQHPGLDSFDMIGGGNAEEVVLRGYWDMSRQGAARERLATGGTFVQDGNASTADLLWLQSRPFTVAPGVEIQFFDHGVRFDGATAAGAEIVPRLSLFDHRAAGPPEAMAQRREMHVDGAGCLAVQWNGVARDTAEPCSRLAVSPQDADSSPRAEDVMWWVEVQAASEEAVTVVLNRMVTDIDRDAPGDQRQMLVGGQVYEWTDIQTDRDRLKSLVLAHILPIGTDLGVPLPNGGPVTIAALAEEDVLPLFPPYRSEYDALQIHDVTVERNSDGFLDSRTDPTDKDAVLAQRTDRVYPSDPLKIRLQDTARESRHHFHFLDPVRVWDPTRHPGTVFVNGIWASPAGGTTSDRTLPILATEGADGFDEAIQDDGDRGWDHFARITMEGPSRVLVDSARLAPAGATARLPDLGLGQPNGASAQGRSPQDPLLIPEATRASGLWIYRVHSPQDLYIGMLEGTDRTPASPLPSPTPVPDRTPETTAPWPSQTVGPTDTPRESPSSGLLGIAMVLLVAGWVARRRSLGR